MSLRLVGAGLPRTGTSSLQAAIERLLGGPCYHMREVFDHPEHAPVWSRALAGDRLAAQACLRGYVAAVDWPASTFWQELAETNPDAVVLLSMRPDARTWWESADATILPVFRGEVEIEDQRWFAMAVALVERCGLPVDDPAGAMAAYERHAAEVRAGVPPERLVEWRPGDGWEPICSALDVPVPDEPFPHRNSREDWAARDRSDGG